MFKIENEFDLHCKVVQYIRRFYPDAIIIAGLGDLGENQDTPEKRIHYWKMGYMKGQPDIMIMNNHLEYNGMCIEFKSPKNNYKITKEQLEMKRRYKLHELRFIIVSDYDTIIYLNNYMQGIRIKCQHCSNQFLSHTTYQIHLENFHKL